MDKIVKMLLELKARNANGDIYLCDIAKILKGKRIDIISLIQGLLKQEEK